MTTPCLSARTAPGTPRRAGRAVPCLTVLLALCWGALPVPAGAAERAVVLDPARSEVTFTLGTTFHEVHGTMALREGTIRFDPAAGTASGTITVDAASAETGNGRRDRTMHADVLESERFPTIVFRLERIEGTFVETGTSEVRLVGVLTLHGDDHPLTLTASVDSDASGVRGELHLPVPYVEWGLHDPSFFVARTEKSVDVTVRVAGSWTDAAATTR